MLPLQKDQLEADMRKLRESLGEMPSPVLRPPFIVLSGLPGSGKTHFWRELVKEVPAVVLESDFLRKVLFRRPAYTPEESSYLFRAVHLLAEQLLSENIPTLVDATNLTERNREYLYNIADRTKARLVIVQIKAPPEVVEERLRERELRPKPGERSDARLETYHMMKEQVEKIKRQHFVVDTSKDINQAVQRIGSYLRKSW